ncbi:MAG: glycosyl hydrolase [Saprospiraceae bacterium]|nr:glycosyl hydrolase [Saprospiraceae bacterium]
MKWSIVFLTFLFLFSGQVHAQDKEATPVEKAISGLKWRNIGPAFCSGRIADIAIHPDDEHTWYIAVGSGGVWKTENSGTTWKSVFDGQPSYSTGCITIDPSNHHTVWVGTGENVGGRHVAYGDGIYRSTDDGKSWKKMGLDKSEHISKIIVHPTNSNIVMVAVQGPLWSKGGERGFYKTIDGGKTWNRTLGDDEWTGVTDVVMDPRDPDILYAATWQRHRTVAAYMGGGPGSGIHRSMDGGETWEKLTSGLPKSNLGKIGLAISPQNPDKVYAIVETDRTKGGLYLSDDRGNSWTKQSNTVSGGTGPHYYQELYASPHKEGMLYLMDVRVQVSTDDGKTFNQLSEREKHSDNHAIAFRPDEPEYLMVGSDGGLYESFDHGETWRFIDNMPITQYYKVAVDDAEPFYFVYGGTQDNGSSGGPSRTDNEHGIMNQDFFKTLFADGHQSATEPGNPNIMYAETQQGGLYRVDRITGEQVYIQPQAGENDPAERFNWDAPIVVSPHNPARLYVASQRVWRSENRGDSWTSISGDLTRNEERMTMPIMGKVQSWDNPWDMKAMSNYNTVTSLSESPVREGVLFAGTDDGIIQISEDGGGSWKKVEVGSIKGIPGRAFINDIRADLHDVNTVYVCLDNHKEGDYKPYLIKSTDLGNSWQIISQGLGDRNLVWRTVQDHVDPNLIFCATETGPYCSLDRGMNWMPIKGGLPTISFRDITIQRREHDLVAASFGRGFFILDDYSMLRNLNEETLAGEAELFPVKDAWWYVEKSIDNFSGHGYYAAENPPYGAVFTYYLSDDLGESLEASRKEMEKKISKEDQDIPFPGWEALEAEMREEKPSILFVIRDSEGYIVNTVEGKTGKGIHRSNWELNYASKNGITLSRAGGSRGFYGRGGFLVTPGTYSVQMYKSHNGQVTPLSDEKNFEVKELRDGALPRAENSEIAAFRKEVESFQQDLTATSTVLNQTAQKLEALRTAAMRTDKLASETLESIYNTKQKILDIEKEMNGDPVKDEVGELYENSPRSMMYLGFRALRTTYGPTEMHKAGVKLGMKKLAQIKSRLNKINSEELASIEKTLKAAGAPWIEGQGLISDN